MNLIAKRQIVDFISQSDCPKERNYSGQTWKNRLKHFNIWAFQCIFFEIETWKLVGLLL